ncbi:polyphosphate kinase 1 [Limibacter armeniacum]|uniref:polyphosphate kinase 1 n=1 Tax=Limibacter armeniacum TaxID=466084 RepID=UPI002FE64181
MVHKDKITDLIQSSNYVSRDLSWLQFNYRVLDQAKKAQRTIFERLKFLAITASNFDEFFMVRVGSLYNYLDYGKSRLDYSGLREEQFRDKLYSDIHEFNNEQSRFYNEELLPQFEANGFSVCGIEELTGKEKKEVESYFHKTIFPMLTPMVYDNYHTFPILQNLLLIFGIVTVDHTANLKDKRKLSFVQVPKNLPRFFEVEREDGLIFIPIESIIRTHIRKLFRNVEIESVDLFRITRNGDYTLQESEDLETDFINELKLKLKTRRTGRVVRVEITPGYSDWMADILKEKWNVDDLNFFENPAIIDYTSLWQIVKHKAFKYLMPPSRQPVTPLGISKDHEEDIFSLLQKNDILLHHPYNSADQMLELLEASAEDPNVLAIKMTIYRLADDSRVTSALLKAVENGKHVSALFEVKARFDEENNISEAKKLQDAGCFVIYGITALKTHTKLMLIVRKEGSKVKRYVHLGTGNYNESTAKLYTDIGLMTTNDVYGEDVSEFFNAITGHSRPTGYNRLLTAPNEMRDGLIQLIDNEAQNARDGLPSGIVIKVNSLQDDKFIDALYRASQAGVNIKLIVRGICCLKPGRKGLSENITIRSIVGEYLEHTRLFYFHNNGEPVVYGGSADAMVRSFDRRIESLFLIEDEFCKQEAIMILAYNLKDNVNAYEMSEDGNYTPTITKEGETIFDIHKEFFNATDELARKAKLF